MQLLQRAGQTRNEEAQAEAALAGLEREAERLAAESEAARGELEALGIQRGQVKLSFEAVTERLKRLEAEIAEPAQRARGQPQRRDRSPSAAATSSAPSRPPSPAAATRSKPLIREHSYSTDTVRNLFRANSNRTRRPAAATTSRPSARSPTSSRSKASTRASSTSSSATSSTTSSSRAGTPPTKACACYRQT